MIFGSFYSKYLISECEGGTLRFYIYINLEEQKKQYHSNNIRKKHFIMVLKNLQFCWDPKNFSQCPLKKCIAINSLVLQFTLSKPI